MGVRARGAGARACGLRERARLLPYFDTLGQLARLTGAPYVRPVWWNSPRDRALRNCEDAFLLGDALLVAPVLEQGATRRAVRLPRGRWYDTATGQVHEGPGQVVVDAPLSRIPVLARAGAVLPVVGADGGTELEVWAPAAGRRGGGLVVPDAGDGWRRPDVRRYTAQWERGPGGRGAAGRERGGVSGAGPGDIGSLTRVFAVPTADAPRPRGEGGGVVGGLPPGRWDW